jgi:hypothetical protein
MGGSIHIHGTGSSIVDTVFVCRQRGTTPRSWLFHDASGLAGIMSGELAELRAAGMKPTAGDIRCMALGHITRMAIWQLRPFWNATLPTPEKLSAFRKAMNALATVDGLKIGLEGTRSPEPVAAGTLFAQEETSHPVDAVAF